MGVQNTVWRMVGAGMVAATFIVSGFFVSVSAAAPGDVVINEFVSNPSTGSEWVEIRNTTGSSIDLTGWTLTELTDPDGTPTEVLLTTLSGNLPAGGIMVFEVSGLNNPGDSIGLKDNTVIEIHRVSYGNQVFTTSDLSAPGSGESGAYNGSTWSTDATPTKGYDNSLSAPTTVYVDGSYLGTLETGAEAQPYNTIQEGENAVGSGGTVIVAAGSYTENVVVDQAVTLQGANAGVDARTRSASETVVTGGGVRAFSLQADNITLDGFTVSGTVGDAGIYLSPLYSGYQIVNNIIEGNTFGLYAHSSGVTQTLVQYNLFDTNTAAGAASGNGIYSDQGAQNIMISLNKFTGHPAAAMLFDSVGGSVTNSTITANSNETVNDSSIAFYGASSITITSNTISNPTESGIDLDGVSGVTVVGNTITGGLFAGIRFNTGYTPGQTENIDLDQNSFTSNDIGVYIESGAVSGSLEFHTQSITGNNTGLQNDDAGLVDAEKNWWGDVTGPNTSTNTLGLGNLVTGNVDVIPWCDDATCASFRGPVRLASASSQIGSDDQLVEPPSLKTYALGKGIRYGVDVENPGAATANQLQWKITVSAPAGLAANDIQIHEMGYDDDGTFGDGVLTDNSANPPAYTFTASGSEFVAQGSCVGSSCTPSTFSLGANEHTQIYDRIIIASSAPAGPYVMRRSLVDTQGTLNDTSDDTRFSFTELLRRFNLADITPVGAAPGGGGGGGSSSPSPTPSPSGSPTPSPTPSTSPSPSVSPTATPSTTSPTPTVLPGTPLVTATPRVLGTAQPGSSTSSGTGSDVGSGTSGGTIAGNLGGSPTPRTSELVVTPLPSGDTANGDGNEGASLLGGANSRKVFVGGILALLAILAILWILARGRSAQGPGSGNAA